MGGPLYIKKNNPRSAAGWPDRPHDDSHNDNQDKQFDEKHAGEPVENGSTAPILLHLDTHIRSDELGLLNLV